MEEHENHLEPKENSKLPKTSLKNPFAKDKNKPSSGTKEYQDYTKYRLSRLIIAGAFVFIGGMLVIHSITVYNVITTNKENSTAISNILDRLDRSNQTLFNILLPVFGAWVGVVVAFYFGTEQARRTQEALLGVLSPQQKIPSGPAPVKVGQELDVSIESMSKKNDGVAIVDGFVIFVADTKKGDNVRVKIIRVGRRYAIAEKVPDQKG